MDPVAMPLTMNGRYSFIDGHLLDARLRSPHASLRYFRSVDPDAYCLRPGPLSRSGGGAERSQPVRSDGLAVLDADHERARVRAERNRLAGRERQLVGHQTAEVLVLDGVEPVHDGLARRIAGTGAQHL